MNKLKYKNKIIEYDIIKSNIKNVYIHIKDSKVIVKAPKKLANKEIIEIINSKKKWIYEKIDKIKSPDSLTAGTILSWCHPNSRLQSIRSIR